jgi:hypothetical protein
MKTIEVNVKRIMVRIVASAVWLTIILFASGGQAQVQPTKSLPANKFKYFGYELSIASKKMDIQSDVMQLNQLSFSQLITTVGIVYVHPVTKVRVNAGMGYSGDQISNSIDALEAGVLGNLYITRFFTPRQSVVEPYVLMNVGYNRTSFFGSYLSTEAIQNYSTSKEELIGRIESFNTSAGLGIEVKLEQDSQHFIHLFAEALAGRNYFQGTGTEDLKNTIASQPLKITLGVSFGLSRN